MSLSDYLARHPRPIPSVFHTDRGSVRLADLAAGSVMKGHLETLRGQSVLLATRDQLGTALALLELDGVVGRVVLITPDLSPELLGDIAARSGSRLIVTDDAQPPCLPLPHCVLSSQPVAGEIERRSTENTEWVLLTSGTTQTPKLVVHSLASLAGTLTRRSSAPSSCVWSTFYDIRRYGGLQIYLRAVLGGTSLELSSPGESIADFFSRAAAHGVTHISGTPSHWRRALMSRDYARLSPDYVRLSGEPADQAVLDSLRAAYPRARIEHAFASTEAGVAFEVDDCREGFPLSKLGRHDGIDVKIHNGTLRIRSARSAARYLGADSQPLADHEGYVDTGDLIEQEHERLYFRGRQGGIINVGGLKVFPEEVEAVLNADSRVRMSRVRGRRSPITGAVVVADIVLADELSGADEPTQARLKRELLDACRIVLSAHKVPAILQFVTAIPLTAAGKLARHDA